MSRGDHQFHPVVSSPWCKTLKNGNPCIDSGARELTARPRRTSIVNSGVQFSGCEVLGNSCARESQDIDNWVLQVDWLVVISLYVVMAPVVKLIDLTWRQYGINVALAVFSLVVVTAVYHWRPGPG